MAEQPNSNQLYNIHGKLATVQDAESNSTQNRELIQKAMNGEKNAFFRTLSNTGDSSCLKNHALDISF